MNKFFRDMYSFDKLVLTDLLLWIYRIGVIFIGVVGVLYGLSEMANSFFGGLFTVIIGTPLAMLVFRIQMEFVYLIVGIYNKLSAINAKIAEPPAEAAAPSASSCSCDSPKSESDSDSDK